MSLTVAAVAMWTRSQFVPEAWGFTPHPIPKPRRDYNPETRGWERWRMVASEGGRFVWVSVDERLYLGHPGHSGGYHRSGFMPPDWKLRGFVPAARSQTQEIPGVAEWGLLTISGDGRFVRVVTVSWLVPAFVGAVLPAVRWWLYRRRVSGPTFPIVSK